MGLFRRRRREYRIEMWRSKDGWRWRIRHVNGNILASSEAYSTKKDCRDTVAGLAKATGFEVQEPGA